jgi:hypothetical protein
LLAWQMRELARAQGETGDDEAALDLRQLSGAELQAHLVRISM